METKKAGYTSPNFEVMDVMVEQGFATSGSTQGMEFENGEW